MARTKQTARRPAKAAAKTKKPAKPVKEIIGGSLRCPSSAPRGGSKIAGGVPRAGPSP